MAAGTAQTDRFLMGSATLMIGAMSAWQDLLPASHSVGLVKNFQIMADLTFANLTEGRTNSLVFSALTNNSVKAQAEVYEYTARNLSYGLALDGSGITTTTTVNKTLTAPIVSGDTIIAVDATTGLAVNDYIMLKDSTSEDVVLVRKITAINSLNLTLDAAVNSAWATATTVISEVQAIALGSTTAPPFLSAKAVGVLPNGTAVEIILPKIRVTKGFTMAWNSEQFSNMPFEIEIFDLVPADAAYASFPNRKGMIRLP